jgi:hypothetical protein
MKTPHTKAYTYIARTLVKGEVHESTYIVALLPTAPSIESYIDRLNGTNRGEYRLVQELEVHKAIYKRGLAGGMICTDWKLLEGMLFHSVEIERKVLVN